MNTDAELQMEAEYHVLVNQLADVLNRSDADALAKPFAALALATLACEAGATASPYLRGRLAAAATVLLQSIDKRLSLMWAPDDAPQAH